MGLFAPSGTPKPIIGLIADVTRDILRKADFQQKLIEDGFEPLLEFGAGAGRTSSSARNWRAGRRW